MDCRGRFIDVFAGWPGSVHDARIFANSSFNLALQEQRILQTPLEPVRPYIIGDVGYALMPRVFVPILAATSLSSRISSTFGILPRA